MLKNFTISLTRLSVIWKISTENTVKKCTSLLSFGTMNHMLSHLTISIIHKDRLRYANRSFFRSFFLMAGKDAGENICLPEYMYVDNRSWWFMGS